MIFLCSTKKDANKIKMKYSLEGKNVVILPIKNKVYKNGKTMKYEVNILDLR